MRFLILPILFLLAACTRPTTAQIQDKPLTASIIASPKSPFIHTRGRQLIDSTGAVITLRGTNLGHWLVPEGYMFDFEEVNAPRQINELFTELVGPDSTAAFWTRFLDRYITEADIKFLAASGANHVRVPFHYLHFTEHEYLGARNAGFTYLDRVVGWCKSAGLYVLLDMHCAPGGQTGDNIDDSFGYPYLYTSRLAQDEFVDIWRRIAQHYRDEPVIVGYDLINEPIAHFFEAERSAMEASLVALYARSIREIRAVDPAHTIFLNGSVWASSFAPFQGPLADNIVYEFHKYWTAPTAEVISEYVGFAERRQVPLYLGESGENRDSWVDSFRVTLDQAEIGYAFWPYKKMRPSSCLQSIVEPPSWDVIQAYAKTPRRSFADIRQHRPDRRLAQAALHDYLQAIEPSRAQVNAGYIRAIGLKVPLSLAD